MTILGAVLGAALAIFPAFTVAPDKPPMTLPATARVVTVNESFGGVVGEYAERVEQYRRYHTRVRVMGICASACTLVISIPNVCVGPKAAFVFHQAFYARPGETPDPNDRSDIATRFLLANYSPAVRAWIFRQGGLTVKILFLQGAELRRIFPACDEATA